MNLSPVNLVVDCVMVNQKPGEVRVQGFQGSDLMRLGGKLFVRRVRDV